MRFITNTNTVHSTSYIVLVLVSDKLSHIFYEIKFTSFGWNFTYFTPLFVNYISLKNAEPFFDWGCRSGCIHCLIGAELDCKYAQIVCRDRPWNLRKYREEFYWTHNKSKSNRLNCQTATASFREHPGTL